MARVAITERAMNAAHVRADQGQPRAHPGRGAGTDAPATAAPTDIEALRQALPQLVRLERYARRAFLRGDRAARRLAAISCYEPEPSTTRRN
jgi:protein-arginine kinase activator protein McsA